MRNFFQARAFRGNFLAAVTATLLLLCGTAKAQGIDTTKFVDNVGPGFKYNGSYFKKFFVLPRYGAYGNDTTSKVPGGVKLINNSLFVCGTDGIWRRASSDVDLSSITLAQLNDSTLRFTNGTSNTDIVFPANDTLSDAGLATRYQNAKKLDTTTFNSTFSGTSSNYVFAGSKTDDNMDPALNYSEGSMAQVNGDTLVNVFLQSYTRAEYSRTGVIGVRQSNNGGLDWSAPRVLLSAAGRPVRNAAIANIGGDSLAIVWKNGSPGVYDTISGLSSLYTNDTIWFAHSEDNFTTLSTPVPIKVNLLPSGNIVYSNGEIRFVAWDNRTASIIRSTDRGATWAVQSQPYTTGTITDPLWNLFEPSFAYLGNNTFRLIARNQLASDNADARFPVYISTNNCATWSYAGILNLPTFNYWKYRTAPSTLTDFRDGKTYISFGTRSQSATNSTGHADSLWVIQDNIADVIANPLIATVKWKVERPVPKAFYYKAMPIMALTSNGLSIMSTEAAPDGSFTGALRYSLYHANIYNTSTPYSLKAITHKYENTVQVFNPVTLNPDFVKAPSLTGNVGTDGRMYINGQKALNGVVMDGLNYGVVFMDYRGASPGNFAMYPQIVVPGTSNYLYRIDQAGNFHLNATVNANMTFRYNNNVALQLYPSGHWQFGNASTTFTDTRAFRVSTDALFDTTVQFLTNVGIGASAFNMSSYGRGIYVYNNNPTVGILGNASTRLESVYSSTFDYRRIPTTGFAFYRVQDLTDATISEFKFNGTGSIDMKSGSGGSGGQFNFYINNAARYAFTPTGLNLANTGSPTTSLQLPSGTAADGTAPIKFAVTNPVLMTNPSKFAGEVDSLNFYYTNGGTVRYTIAKTLTNTVTIDFPSTAAGTSSEVTFTLTGVAAGDIINITATDGSSIANGMINARGTGANTGTAKFLNASSGAIDPASNTYRVAAIIYH